MTASFGALCPWLIGLLEEAVESRAGIIRVAGHRDVRCGRAASHTVRRPSVRRIARHGDAQLEQLAFVGLVFHRDPHRNRLQALEPRRRLEMRALLAAMQRRAALGTVPSEIDVARKRGGTVKATRRRYALYHPRQARPGNVNRRAWTLRAWTLFAALPAVSGIIAAGVLIAALPVLTFAFYKFLVGSLLWF